MQSAAFFFINYALRSESELNFAISLEPTVIKGQFFLRLVRKNDEC